MNSQSEGNGPDLNEIDLFKICANMKAVFARYKYWMLATPVVFMFLGLGLSTIPKPQWEAVSILQVGKVSPSDFVEPLPNLILRLSTYDFQKAVLTRCGIALDSPEALLYQNTLNAKPHKVAGLIEIKVRGLSRQSALQLSSATVSEIHDIHVSMIASILSGPKRRLAAMDKLNPEIAETLKNSKKQLSPEAKSLADVAAAYLSAESWQLKFTLLDQMDFPELHPTVLVNESASTSPISPRKSLWMEYSLLLGLFLSILVPMALLKVKM